MKDEIAQQDVVSLALQTVGAISGPPFSTYSDLKANEQKLNAIYIGYIAPDGHFYVPKTTTKKTVREAGRILKTKNANHPKIKAALKNLWLTTKHEKLDKWDQDALFEQYANKLSPYPTIEIVSALDRIGNRSKFFPSWQEIQEELGLSHNVKVALLMRFKAIHDRLTE